MTQEDGKRVQLLEYNVHRLISIINQQNQIIKDLEERVKRLYMEIEELSEKYHAEKDKNSMLTASRFIIANNRSVEEARLQITEMIDNIDRCLLLLDTASLEEPVEN